MGYNVIDIINKAINISNRKKAIYEIIGQKKSDIPAMAIVLKILMRQIGDTIIYYESLKTELEKIDFEEIDIGIYDKISYLINEFNLKLFSPDINNVRDFLEFSLTLEKNTYALFIDIQGRLIRNSNDVNTKAYEILSKMIKNKQEFILVLEKIVK
jgi:hypothetical protein